MAEQFDDKTSQLTDIVFTLARSENVTPTRWLQWVELSTWQRLLLSCYKLETEQAMLLAREPVSSLFNGTGMNLPFPAHTLIWDAMSLHEWGIAVRQYSSPEHVYDVSQDSLNTPCDSFQSSVLIAVYYNRFGITSSYVNVPLVHDIDHVIDTTFITKQRLLTAKLIQVTPIRALLAASGETWILSEKVSQQEFTALKNTLRTWIAQLWTPQPQSSAIKTALQLSVAVLQSTLAEDSGVFALGMGYDMGVYFASLVLWAVTTASSTRGETSQKAMHRQPPISTFIPSIPLPETNSFSAFSLTSSSNLTSTPSTQRVSLAAVSLRHDHIILESTSFLAAMRDFDPALHDICALQTGCVSILLWVKMQLRDVPPDRDHDWPSGPGDGLGELMDSVIGSLERVLKGGWEGWGI
jgi:hypothetical protein